MDPGPPGGPANPAAHASGRGACKHTASQLPHELCMKILVLAGHEAVAARDHDELLNILLASKATWPEASRQCVPRCMSILLPQEEALDASRHWLDVLGCFPRHTPLEALELHGVAPQACKALFAPSSLRVRQGGGPTSAADLAWRLSSLRSLDLDWVSLPAFMLAMHITMCMSCFSLAW